MNFSVDNVVNPGSQGFTSYAEIPDPGIGCNSGPQFTGPPLIAACNLDTINFNHSAIDPDGDSLVYSLCHALDANVTPPQTGPPYSSVPYQSPYVGSYPIPANPPLQIDPSGIVTGVPYGLGCYIVAICVDEYQGGTLVGSYQRSIILCVMPCTTVYAQALLPDTIYQCVGVPFQFPNLSTGGNTFFWDFGTGNPADTSNLAFPNFSYAAAGNYTVTLIVNPGQVCADTISGIVHASLPPIVSIAGLQPNYFANDPPDTLIGTPPGGTFSGPGITDSIFDPALAGVGTHVIYYSFTDTNGCSGVDSMTTMLDSATGVSELGNVLVIITPNPARDFITIDLSERLPVRAVIYDMNGKALFIKDFSDGHATLELTALPSGCYLIHITGDEMSWRSLFIKQ